MYRGLLSRRQDITARTRARQDLLPVTFEQVRSDSD